MSGERIVLAGGAGFVGRALAAALQEHGHRVTVMDRRPCEVPGATVLTRDLLRDALPVSLFQDVSAVVNLAALLPCSRAGRAFYDVNVGITERLLATARDAGVPRFVHLSSSVVYGIPQDHTPLREEAPPRPIDDYGESKRQAEVAALRYASHGLSVAVVRPRFIVGAGRLGLLTILFDWVRRGRRIPLIGDGHNRFQMLPVRELVEVLRLATFSRAEGLFNVAAAPVPTVRELISALIAHACSHSRILGVPAGAARAVLRGLDALHLSPLGREHYLIADHDYCLDTTRARMAFGWEARQSTESAMCEAYDHWLAHRDTYRERGSADFPREGVVGLLGRLL